MRSLISSSWVWQSVWNIVSTNIIICIWILSWQDKIVMKQCKISSQSHPHFDYRYFHGILSISSFTFQSYYIGPILSIIHMNNMNSLWHKNPSLMFLLTNFSLHKPYTKLIISESSNFLSIGVKIQCNSLPHI